MLSDFCDRNLFVSCSLYISHNPRKQHYSAPRKGKANHFNNIFDSRKVPTNLIKVNFSLTSLTEANVNHQTRAAIIVFNKIGTAPVGTEHWVVGNIRHHTSLPGTTGQQIPPSIPAGTRHHQEQGTTVS